MAAKIAQELAESQLAQDGSRPRPEPADADDTGFVPTTDFGRRLLELRGRIIAEQGGLDRAGLEREIAERRGGLYTGPDR